eukprot:TRINITY_DN19400_c0_g1_i1.p1 TRINITY_DN19400_c0_g1~~TRINITY_DN19400_c0_g1_i1.p1  ORF type:complete len:304 (+),score=95.80 TRINITY_DN19400_c0_g1_i1:55-966(+)
MHDPNLKHKVFGSMAAAGLLLMCFMAFIVGKSNVDVAEQRGNQMKQTVGIMRERLHLCKSELLEMVAHKDKTSEKESINQLKLSNQLLERENALLMNIYNDLLSNTADCESDQKRSMEQRGIDDSNIEMVIDRLGFENRQLEDTKDKIKQEKKELSEMKKKYISAMRLENRELRAELAAKELATHQEEEARRQREAATTESRETRKRSRTREEDEEEERRKEEEERDHEREVERKRYSRRRERREYEDEEVPPPPRKKRCVDLSDDCAHWADDGECTTNKAYMAKNCKRSCGLCRRHTRERDD